MQDELDDASPGSVAAFHGRFYEALEREIEATDEWLARLRRSRVANGG